LARRSNSTVFTTGQPAVSSPIFPEKIAEMMTREVFAEPGWEAGEDQRQHAPLSRCPPGAPLFYRPLPLLFPPPCPGPRLLPMAVLQ